MLPAFLQNVNIVFCSNLFILYAIINSLFILVIVCSWTTRSRSYNLEDLCIARFPQLPFDGLTASLPFVLN